MGITVPTPKGFKQTEETKRKISDSKKGEKNPFFGKRHSEQTKLKMSIARKGKLKSKETRRRMSESLKGVRAGEKNPNWKGGVKVGWARRAANKRKRGFIIITNKNPYVEKIVYHHIDKNLPYVIPCPERIHKMFPGSDKMHWHNVNAMLGFKLEGAE